MSNKIIRLDKPATSFTNSFFVGNGRSGAAVYGAVTREAIELNEDTVWHGKDYNRRNPEVKEGVKEVRKLLLEEKPDEALSLARRKLLGSPKYINPYVPLATLEIVSDNGQVDGQDIGNYTDYARYLDLENGIAYVSYKMNGISYSREVFASYPDGVTVVRLCTETPGALSFSAFLFRRPYDDGAHPLSDDSVVMNTVCGEGGVEFSCILKAIPEGGTVTVYNDTIYAEKCDSVTLLIRTDTSYRVKDYKESAKNAINKASSFSYEELKKRHTDEHSAMFNRVDLCLGNSDDKELITTSERLENARKGEKDSGLFELLFNYGRYLLMGSARPGSLMSTLQGIWNNQYAPGWECAYTININTEMNYWAAENTNLSECHLSLADFMEKVHKRGQVSAKEIYDCRGFVAHHNLNHYADTDFEGRYDSCVVWPMGGAWLSLHLWEHYAYTLDEEFLRIKAYPILKDAALFMLDYMTEDENGQLLTGPSLSPENTYMTKDGRYSSLCMAPAMDVQIVKTLFDDVVKACDALGTDSDFKNEIIEARKKLPPEKITSDGRIMEWQKEYIETEIHHRHTSHLFGLFPGELIDEDTPELLQAAKKTLITRIDGNENTWGWCAAWRACMYARMKDSQNAYTQLDKIVKDITSDSLQTYATDSMHIFQIDANSGFPAAVCEMLMQSHKDVIRILPTLPDEWADGHVTGLKARGGFSVDIEWKNKKPVSVKIIPAKTNTCTLLFPEGVSLTSGELCGNRITFTAEEGKEYIFS